MQFLIYLLLYPFLYIISILPFPILYLVSDCVYVLVYYIIGYRKKTVRENLTLAFPNLSKEELLKIEKKFFFLSTLLKFCTQQYLSQSIASVQHS